MTDEASQNYTFGYDAADKLTSKILPNSVTTSYDYDGMSRLTRLKNQSLTATLTDNNFIYNPANQISQIAELAQTKTFSYDNVNRLTGMTNGTTSESYNFDTVGNRTYSHRSNTYGYQPNNKLVSTQTGSYSYDANGNMKSKSDASGYWIYSWDYENRMTTARNRNKSVRYQYDALGRRVSRLGKGVGATAKYTYDGLDVILDDGSDGVVKYQNAPGIDNKLKLTSGGISKYFLQDHLGSTVGLTDSSGAITSAASYDSFGNSTNNLTTRFQYTGREYDSFTGLQYNRARWYDSNLGRFISQDPIGFAGGDVNLYGYVWNNPQGFTDPTGLDGWGNDTADWLDEKLNVAHDFYGFDPLLGFNPITGQPETFFGTLGGFANLFRVGNGVAQAYYCEDTIYGQAAYVMMDVGRAAGIAGIVLGIADAAGAGSPSEALPPQPRQTPNYLGQTKGPSIPVPQGATGNPIINPGGKTTGFGYTGGKGGNGLNPRVEGVRVMDPTLPKGKSPGYPNGYVNYMNKGGQSVNPYTGQTVPKNSPWWHIPLE